jgi:PilZ domain-containing protein
MAVRATLPTNDGEHRPRPKSGSDATPNPAGHRVVTAISTPTSVFMDHKSIEVHRALHNFHLLLRSERLYEKNHPYRLDSLDSAYDSLRQITETLEGLEIRIERGGIVVPKIGEGHLPDARGEMQLLAADLHRVGVWSLVFSKKFHVGELDTLARLMRESLLKSEAPAGDTGSEWWTARLLENRVEGISVNTQTERRVDTVLASLIGALVAYGGNAPRENSDSPIKAPDFDDLMATLHLLARLTPPLESARGLSPEEAARAIHGSMEEASRESVRMLLHSVSQYGPRDGEQPLPYLLRLSENIIFEFLSAEFAGGSLTPPAVRTAFHRLADALVESGAYTGPHASQHLSSLAVTWATDKHREQLIDRFWQELPAREKSAVLRGPDVWCVPVAALRQTLGQLADAGADAPRREARNIVLNYLRRLELPDTSARRSLAAGLNELVPIIESLWPNQLPEDFSRNGMKALQGETAPETAALLAALVEALGRIAVTRADYSGFEFILTGLERAPRDKEHDHMTALSTRLVAQDRWFLLVDASLANRPLDPVLPRLLQRDPERLLDRLTLLLTEPRGVEMLQAMARLLRTIGVPVLNLLETRLYEARRQRVTAAIKLLAAADPERLLRGLARAIGSWEWNLQDLAVSELSRPSNAGSGHSAAFVFSAILADAHPMVVPMMIDQIGLAQEATAVPHLLEIAAGEHEVLRDQFVRIKAIEALGRMRSYEAAELLRTLTEKREGLAYAEPAGLRAAAEDALALIENHPSFKQAAAAFGAPAQSSSSYPNPRRYVRVPLESPLRAQIDGSSAGLARVKTISLGGAYLESPRKLTVGDSIKLEVRTGLRKINFTAVVRNIGQDGNGIEFVHMRDEDRERLRKFVQRHLQL